MDDGGIEWMQPVFEVSEEREYCPHSSKCTSQDPHHYLQFNHTQRFESAEQMEEEGWILPDNDLEAWNPWQPEPTLRGDKLRQAQAMVMNEERKANGNEKEAGKDKGKEKQPEEKEREEETKVDPRKVSNEEERQEGSPERKPFLRVRASTERRSSSPPLPGHARPAVNRPPSLMLSPDALIPTQPETTTTPTTTNTFSVIPGLSPQPASPPYSSLPSPTSPPPSPTTSTPPPVPTGPKPPIPSPRSRASTTGPRSFLSQSSPGVPVRGVIGSRNMVAPGQQQSLVNARANWKEGDKIV